MPAFRFLARLSALLFIGIGAASAQADYRVYVDTDADAATGCSVTLPGSGVTIDGMEARLTAAKDAGTQIVDVTRETCSGSGFGAAVSVGGGYPVGLGLGTSGADVVELADSLAGLGATGGSVRLAFTAEASVGDDALVQADGGGAILASLPQTASFPIPGLGLAGMLFLVGLLGLAGWVILRRRPGAGWMIVGLIVAGTAWAAHRMADGDPGDWTGGPLATDAQFDAPLVVDILAGFVAFEDGRLYARIDVADVENAAPAADATSATVDEDAGPVTVNLSGSDPEGDPLTFAIATGPSLGTLGAVTSTGTTTATVDYTPDPDANGSDSFTYTASDGTTPSAPATASITVNPVNDNPDAVDDSFTVDEDSTGNALDPLANDTDAPDTGETLAITGTGVPDQGGSVSITGGGTGLSYTPPANFTGTETFTYTIGDGNGGADTATVSVTASDVNDPPTVTDIADQTIPEDGTTGPLAFSVGDAESAAGALTVTASSSNQTLLPDGNLTLGGSGANRTIDATPAADRNGTTDITITVEDPDGGTASTTFQLTVTSENDTPTITAIADQSILEDGTTGPLAFTVDDTETAAGSLTVTAASGDAAIIPDANLALGGSGANRTITAIPAADAFGGPVTVTVTVQDTDGGSTPETFGVTVNPVNDAPSFGLAGDVASDEDAGPQSVANQATGISAGPGEGGQTVSFQVTNDNNALFSSQPAIDASGTLTYTSALNANGSAQVTVTAMDDGGTANGGVDTSGSQTFTITVNPVNDPPQVTAPGPFSVTGNLRIQVTGGVDDLLAGANDDADGGTVLSVTPATPTSSAGGDVTINADGTFSYNPPAGYEGADSFSYEVCDSGVPGSACTSATVSLNVSDIVWFVDPSASAGDGRLTSPFNDVDALDAVNDGTGDNPAAGDDIFLYTGTHDGTLVLLDNQRVFGQGATSSLAAMTGITVPAYSDPFPATGGARPNWTATNATALTVAQGNTLRGFDIGNTGSGIDIAGTNFGTLTISELDLLGSGQALDLNTGTLAGSIGALASTSGSRNVSLVDVAGTPTFGSGSVSGAANQAFYVDGGAGTFSYSGSITNTNDRLVQIQNKTGGGVTLSGNLTSNSGGTGVLVSGNSAGTYTFSGSSKAIDTGANPAVTLTSNTGATVNFSNGGLDIDTTSGTGFSATGGGTVTVTGTGNTVNATTGTGINIADTTIGASGVAFRSVSVDGATHGIALANTGNTGGFTVSGDGATSGGLLARNGSGGVIQNTSDDGVELTNAFDVTLRQMDILGVGDTADPLNIAALTNDHAVQSVGGGNITLSAVTLRDPIGTGWEAFDISGTNRIDNASRVDQLDRTSNFNGVRLTQQNTNFVAFTVADTVVDLADPTPGDPATNGNALVVLSTRGSVNGTFELLDSTITGARGQAATLNVGDTSGSTGTVGVNVSGNTFTTAHPINGQNNLGVSVSQGTTGNVDVLDNTFSDTGRGASLSGQIIVQQSDSAALDLLIQNNEIGGLATPDTSRQRGIDVLALSTSTSGGAVNAEILGNRVFDIGRSGIYMSPRGQIGEFDVRVANNTLGRDPAGAVDPVGYEDLLENAGIQYSVGTASDYDVNSRVLIENNEVIVDLASGIRTGAVNLIIDPFSGGAVTGNITVRNNTLDNRGTVGNNFHALVRDAENPPNEAVMNLDLGNSGANNAINGAANYVLEVATFFTSGTLTVEDLANVDTDNQSNGATPATVTITGPVTDNSGNVSEPVF